MAVRNEDCRSGDFTVTRCRQGYLIGQVTPELGPGTWWSYVATVKNLGDALSQATALARHSDSRAWYVGDGSSNEAIPLDDVQAEVAFQITEVSRLERGSNSERDGPVWASHQNAAERLVGMPRFERGTP
jgi:hypothetical protein